MDRVGGAECVLEGSDVLCGDEGAVIVGEAGVVEGLGWEAVVMVVGRVALEGDLGFITGHSEARVEMDIAWSEAMQGI